MMTLEQLRVYDNWVAQTPATILELAKHYGGWTKVFDQKLPLWASRLRNFFNVAPRMLTRSEIKQSIRLIESVSKARNRLEERQALAGDAYRDEAGRVWFLMSPGGAIYHFGSQETWEPARVIGATLTTQSGIPVFKLVSPDGSGGSMEVIVKNVAQSMHIGDIGKPTKVSGLIETDKVMLGSYNYSETVVAGYNAHVMRDVETDPMKPEFFFSPFDIFSGLGERKFHALTDTDWRDKPAAGEQGHLREVAGGHPMSADTEKQLRELTGK